MLNYVPAQEIHAPSKYVHEQYISSLQEDLKKCHLTPCPRYASDRMFYKEETTGMKVYFDEKTSTLTPWSEMIPENMPAFINILKALKIKNLSFSLAVDSPHIINDTIEAKRKSLHLLLKALPYTNVSFLDLHGTNICTLNEILHLAEALPQTSVTKLDISNMRLKQKEIEIIADCLPKTKITKLNASHNEFGNEGFCAIAKVLPFTKIEELEISEDFVQMIQNYRPQALYGKQGKYYDYQPGFAALQEGIQTSNVCILKLLGMGISTEAFKSITEIIKYSNLQELWIEINLKNQDMDLLLESLKGSKLKKLHIISLYFSNPHLIQLIQGVSFSEIEELDLRGNSSLDLRNVQKMEEFFHACSQSTHLRTLHITIPDRNYSSKLFKNLEDKLKAYKIDLDLHESIKDDDFSH